MFKFLKITSRLVLALGLVILSFKPSIVNYVTPNIIHPHHVAFSKFESISKRTPFSTNGSSLRCSFQKNDNKRHFVAPVAAVPMFDAFVFNAPRFNSRASSVFYVTASSPSETVVLRI